MQNILSLIRDFKRMMRPVLLLLAGIFLISSKAASQSSVAQVTVNINILPPYSPYYSDYSGANAGKVMLIIRNLTPTQKTIKLTGQLIGDNGIKVSTKSTYVPLQPIILQPNETKQLNGTALKDVFDLNTLNVYGVDKVKLVRTSRLPEGNYDFCVQATDLASNTPLSDAAPVGCTKFNISYPNAPILISPTPFAKVYSTTPQNIVFNWMNPGTVPMNTQYTIQVAAMPEVSMDPNQLLNSTTFPLLNQRIVGTSYIYGGANVPMKIGKTYAWRIIASDPTGKTGFMNDGKSQAAVFVYGSDEQLAIIKPPMAIPDLLNIVSPGCKDGTDMVMVGPNTNLNLNWLWKDQIESVRLFGSLDSNLLKHYTKVNVTPVQVNADSKQKSQKADLKVPDVYETIKYYRLHIYRQSGSMGKSLIYLNIPAPLQSLSFTKKQVDSLGFFTGQSYKLIVTALNQNDKQIGRTESCVWTLKAEPVSQIPRLTIRGKINYSFDKTNYFGANKASIALQFVRSKTEKAQGGRIVMVNNNFAMQPLTYVTTDSEGNFTAQIDQLVTDTGRRYLAININSPFYQKPDTSILVNIPKIAALSDGKTVTYTQAELKLSDVNTGVYNYSVTVNLSKMFDPAYAAVLKDANGQDVANNYSVETGFVNAAAKVDAGILVGIYRKIKKEDIPRYEGDLNIKSPQFPLPPAYIRVAEARTLIKDGKTQVVFNRLLVNWAYDDEYYIKAILPKADPNNKTQNDNEADLVAPEQRLSFYPAFNPATLSYATTVNYRMVSKKPPTAKIKGKIMQQWPSAPGVLYPYANKAFAVKMINANSFPNGTQIPAPDACQHYPGTVKQKVTGADGKTSYVDIPGAGESFDRIVATGVTDKDGNYELSIFDFMEMKNFNVEVVQTSNTPVGKTCAEIAAEEKAEADAKQAALVEKLKELAKTGDVGFLGKGRDAARILKKQIEDLRKATGEGLGADGSAATDSHAGTGPEIIIIGAGATSLIDKYGVGQGGGGTSNPATNPSGGGTNYQFQNFSPTRDLSLDLAGAMNFTGQVDISSSGPSSPTDNADAALSFKPAALTGTVSRYFVIEGISPVSTVNNDPGNTAGYFVVQPFGSVNLGVSVVNIEEVTDFKVKAVLKVAKLAPNSSYKLEITDALDNNALNGAKLVIFRTEKKRPAAGIYPPGEGAPVHPIKKLINATYSAYTPKYSPVNEQIEGGALSNPLYKQVGQQTANGYDESVEWILDETVGPVMGSDNSATFNLGNRRLWKKGDYFALITPNPDGNGGRFDPMIINLDPEGTSAKVDIRVSPSRVSGRVIDNSSSLGLSPATVNLNFYESGSNEAKPKNIPADQNGYFNYTNGSDLTWGENARFTAQANVAGYGWSWDEIIPTVVVANGQNYEKIIRKVPGAILKGIVYGEPEGNAAAGSPYKEIGAYIKLPDGSIYEEAELKKGIRIRSNVLQKITIIPKDPGYFTEEMDVNAVGTKDIIVNLKRLKHRIRFVVKEPNGQAVPANSVRITFNNDAKLTKLVEPGATIFEFENVSVNNYTVQIAPANGSNYIPKIISLSNQESREPTTQTVNMEKGAVISGHVTLNGANAVNARVYMDYAASDAIPNGNMRPDLAAMEDLTDVDGNYEIKGIHTADNVFVKIHVTMNANVTVNGAEKNVQILNKAGKADFALNSFNGPLVNSIYGFPLSIEHIEKTPDNNLKVTGIVDLGKNNSSFSWLNPDTKIRISDVVLDAKNNYQPIDAVPLDAVAEIKMKYLDKYTVKVQKTTDKLSITQNGDGGAILARVSITDNSFNFPSAHLDFSNTGEFFLSKIGEIRSPNITRIKAIHNGPKEIEGFFLSDKKGDPLTFSLAGFTSTTANPKKSYIDVSDGRIHLDVKIKGEVMNSSPGTVNVDINDLVLDGNKVYPAKGTEPLLVNLQTWQLLVKDWTLDVKQGGIISKNSTMRAGLVDIPVNTFNLRHDMFVIKGFDVTKLSLGNGMLPLTGIDSNRTNFNLVFDEACGSDHSAHWRFSASPKFAEPVATIPIPAVAGKFAATNLKVNYFQLISYNKEDLISLSGAGNGVQLYGNPKFTFYPASVTSNVGSYALAGQAAFAVPRVNNVAMSLLFEKPDGVKLDVRPMSFKMGFEGKGYVQFANDPAAALITNVAGITGIRGTVVEPGKFNPIPCTLNFGIGNAGKVILDVDHNLNLDGAGKATESSLMLKIGKDLDLNGMMVQTNNDWGTLKFSGELTDPKSAGLVTKKPIYNFEVLGDIQANSKELNMEKATPLGNVQLTYDFAARQMMGSLRMNDVEFGSYKFSGDVEISYGSSGMLILGAGQLNTGTLLADGFGTFNIGMLFANANLKEGSIQKVTQYSRAKDNICWLRENKDNFKGFFLTGGYDIINEHKGFDIGIASIYLNAVLGVEASIGANFNTPSFKALIGAHGEVSAGMSAITGTSISGSIKAQITASAEYNPSGFIVEGKAGVTVGYTVSQYLVLKTVTFDGSQEAKVAFHLQKGNTNFKFSLGKENGVSECPPLN
jgi:uncharacterized GH25 family protein